MLYVSGGQNYGPLLGPVNTSCRIILRTKKRDLNSDNHPYCESVSISTSISPLIWTPKRDPNVDNYPCIWTLGPLGLRLGTTSRADSAKAPVQAHPLGKEPVSCR